MENNRREFDHNLDWQSTTVAEKYDDRRFKSFTGHAFDKMEKSAISKLLHTAEKEQSIQNILDLPSGTGRISEILAEKGYDVCCGDISDEMLQVARNKLAKLQGVKTSYSVLDIYNIEFPPNSFDCVTCIRLFQHLTSDERAKALKELARVSRRFVVVNVMYTSAYYGLIRKARQRVGAYAPRYTTNHDEMISELEYSSLKLKKSIFPQPYYNGNRVLLLEKI